MVTRRADRLGQFKTPLRPATVRGSTRFDPRSCGSRFVSRRPRWAPGKVAPQSCSSVSARKEWKFFAVLPQADRPLAVAWWLIVVLRGVLPAVFAIAMGVLVAAVQHGNPLAAGLAFVGTIFILLQVLTPIHQAVGANLGDRTAAWLYDRLTDACVRPPGMGHLEDPEAHQRPDRRPRLRPGHDRSAAVHLDGLHRQRPGRNDRRCGLGRGAGGLRLVGALVLAGAWLATHWLLRESAVWRDRNTDEVRRAQRDADYAYRLAVDPPASKELRLFGLVGLDDRSLRQSPHAALPTAIRGDAAPRAARVVEHAVGRRRQRHRLLVARRLGGERAASIWAVW